MFGNISTVSEVEGVSSLIQTLVVPHKHGSLILKNSDTTESSDSNSDILFFHGNEFSFQQPSKKHRKEYRQNLSEISAFFNNAGLTLSNIEIYKPLRRHSDTIFFPIDLGANSPFYIYPWLSDKTSVLTETFPKIKQFVMANCLFGASILGVDYQGNKYPLIDHHLEVKDIIINIEVDENVHPYEDMSFSALQGLLPLIQKIGDENFSIRYHLPVIDYILYGVHLYISGKVTFDAFKTFVEQVKERGRKHKEIIINIAKRTGINIDVESPFDNLFSVGTEITASKLLEQLSLSTAQLNRMQEEHPKLSHCLNRIAKRSGHRVDDFKAIIAILNTIDELFTEPAQALSESNEDNKLNSPRILFEELCIENILDHLIKNEAYPEYQQVWTKIIASGEINRFTPLQQLFKVANVAFIARASIGHSKFEVCSLLPIDEKPIAQSYKDSLSEQFGHILCLSWFPPLLNYISHEENQSSKHYQNNLFRLRTDLVRVDQENVRECLSDYFKLPSDFWSIIDRFFCGRENSEINEAFIPVAENEQKPSVYPINYSQTLWSPDDKKIPITRSISFPIF